MAMKKTKTTKATTRDRSGALYVLLEPEVLASLDAWAERLNIDNTGPQWSRTAVVRAVIARALRERGEKGERP